MCYREWLCCCVFGTFFSLYFSPSLIFPQTWLLTKRRQRTGLVESIQACSRAVPTTTSISQVRTIWHSRVICIVASQHFHNMKSSHSLYSQQVRITISQYAKSQWVPFARCVIIGTQGWPTMHFTTVGIKFVSVSSLGRYQMKAYFSCRNIPLNIYVKLQRPCSTSPWFFVVPTQRTQDKMNLFSLTLYVSRFCCLCFSVLYRIFVFSRICTLSIFSVILHIVH